MRKIKTGRATRSRRDLVKLCLASGLLVSAGVGATAAAYLDTSAVTFTPVGATYDMAFVDGDGALQQGDREPYVIDMSGKPPINRAGAPEQLQVDLVIRNAGTTTSGTVDLELLSLLPPQPADADGVIRDPFDVLVATVWDEDGNVLAEEEKASTLLVRLEAWPAGEDRRFTLQLSYKRDMGSPYYLGKHVRVGLTASGESA